MGDGDTVICADDTTCDDNAASPCTLNETESDETVDEAEPQPTETPSNSEAEPTESPSETEPESTEAPNEPSEENEDGNDGSEVSTPGGEDDEAETTSGNSDPNESESSTADDANGENGSGESTEPSDSDGSDTSTTNVNELTSESNSVSDGSSSSTSPEESTTTSETPEFTCEGVGRFPHPTDCQKYNFCWDLEHPYVTFTCKAKLVYNAHLGRCAEDWSACPNAPQCVANHQVLAVPNDNRFYFICKNIGSPLLPQFVIHKKECDKHSTFDQDLLVCVLNGIDDGEGSDSSSESQEHHEKVKFECSEAGIFPDFFDDSKYYECIIKNIIKGKLKTHHRSCPKNHVFSLQDQLCIPIVVDEVLIDE